MPLEEGTQFCADTASGEMAITVTEVREDSVIVDANHPLAGMTLHFDVEVLDVRRGTDEELRLGQAVLEDRSRGQERRRAAWVR